MTERVANHPRSRELTIRDRRRIAERMTAMTMVYASAGFTPKMRHYVIVSEDDNIFQGIAEIEGISGNYLAVSVEPETVRRVTDPLTPESFAAFQHRRVDYSKPLKIYVICDEAIANTVRSFSASEMSGSVVRTQKADGELVTFFVIPSDKVQSMIEKRARIRGR